MVCETNRPTAESAARASVSAMPTRSSGTIASPGPSEIVRITPEPGRASLAASGIWLATLPDGIRGSCARVIVTTYSTRVARASSSVRPTTFANSNPILGCVLSLTDKPTMATIAAIRIEPAAITKLRRLNRPTPAILVVT